MQIKKKNLYSGMTLLEVLVALMVFGTGVLVIMLMMTRNISRMQEIKLKTTATLLSKEWLELIYYIRDTNIKQSMYRDCIQKDVSTSSCIRSFLENWQQNAKYTVGSTAAWELRIEPLVNPEDARLFLQKDSEAAQRYVHTYDGSGAPALESTPYSRTITISAASWYENHADTVLSLRSTVTYQKWSTQWEVTLESFIAEIK